MEEKKIKIKIKPRIKNKKVINKFNETRSWFFRKTDNIDNLQLN